MSDSTHQTKSGSAKRGKWWVIAAAIGFGLVFGGYHLAQISLFSPVHGSLTQSSQPKDQAKPSGEVALAGTNFGLAYPSGYREEANTPQSLVNVIERHYLLAGDLTSYEHLAITYAQLPTTFAEYPSYHFRQINPQLYHETVRTTAAGKGYIMTKLQDGFEQTAFIPHGDKVLVMAFETNSGDVEASSGRFDHMLSSLHWR